MKKPINEVTIKRQIQLLKREFLCESLDGRQFEKSVLHFAIRRWGDKPLETKCLKLGEESGEVQGAMIRIIEGRGEAEQLKEELGDLLIVAAQIAAKLDTSLADLLCERIARRHPEFLGLECKG